jgi:hypothetical protein
MRAQNKLFRLSAWVAIAGMVLVPALQDARAQVPPAPGVEPEAGPEVTPPSRVGRLAWTQGTVSFHTADEDSWSPAVLNYPVTSGNSFWTQPDSEAGLEVSDVLVAMSPTTELDVDTLDDTAFVATEPQGEVYVRVRSLLPGESYTLQTPRGTVTIGTPGRYEIAAGTTETPTLVTVLEGAAQVAGTQPIDVGPGQTLVITGEQEFQTQLTPATHDAFLDSMLAREQPRGAARTAPPPIVAQMPGGDELAEYGTWSQNPQYGQVWYPQVGAGWAPYREGHWAYVAPWGWTWIDDAPWGFAPFHYGRWAWIDGRWAWIPAEAVVVQEAPVYPVYAPALVAFFGIGLGIAAGVGWGGWGGSVGWCPLGPGEAWYPWFHASPRYFRQVNIYHVTNINNITNVTNINNSTINNFRNARAATVVPASTMVTSQPVRAVAHTVSPATLAQVHPVIGRPPVPPTTVTRGVTSAVARQVHLAPPPAGVAVPPRQVAPGPAIHPTVVAARPGGHPAVPLRTPTQATAGVSATPHVGTPGLAGRPGAVPGTIPPSTAGGAATAAGLAHAPPMLRPPGSGQAGPPPIQHETGRTAHLTTPNASPGAGPAPARTFGAVTPTEPGATAGAITPAVPHTGGTSTAPHVAAPASPSVHAPYEPPHATANAPPPLQPTSPIPATHAAGGVPPAATPHPTPEMHAYTPPASVAHPAVPPATAYPAAPQPPVAHYTAPPVAAVHPVAPPPQMHAAAPPPMPAPQMHVVAPPPRPMPAPAPPPQQQHAQRRDKRPGEP